MKRSLIADDRLEAVNRHLGPRSHGKMKISTARSGGKVKRSTARSDGKRKSSLKDELKELKEDVRHLGPRSHSDGKWKSSLKDELRELEEDLKELEDVRAQHRPRSHSDGKVKRSTARSDGKRKNSLKDKPMEDCRAQDRFIPDLDLKILSKRMKVLKDDPIFKKKYVPRLYRPGYSLTEISTEIPLPRLMELAAKVVASYNKRKGLDFQLVEAIKGFSLLRDDTTFDHLNFKAKLKDSSDVNFFFGELVNGKSPTCYILDPTRKPCTWCDMCSFKKGQVLLHPRDITRSLSAPPSSHEIHMEPPLAPTPYECELIKAGGSEEKAKVAYREFLHNAYAMPC